MSKEKETSFNDDSVNIQTETEKCPSCGSNFKFDPDSNCLICEHCGTKKEILTDATPQETALTLAFGVDRDWSKDETAVFKCDNCGAKVVLQKDQTAEICPFCGTAHVVKTDELAGIKPSGLIPFAFGYDKGVEFAKKWAKKRLFAPSKFKKTLSPNNVQGVYAPCFTFDSNTWSTYEGRIGKHHTRVVGSGKNRRTQTYTVWRNISGRYNHAFDDVLINAGSRLDQKKMDKLSPFDTNNGKAYEEDYILGFMAYHYDKDVTDCWETAKGKIDAEIRRLILSQYSYDVVSYLNVSTTHENVTYKYVMLPVYVGNYAYRQKVYNFYVNGSTGKVTGKMPVSPWRVLITVLGVLAVVVGIIALVQLTG